MAVVPFTAQADLIPMEDFLMGNTTVQAGAPVEISIAGSGIAIDEIEYEDESSVLLHNDTVNNINDLSKTVDVEGNLLLERQLSH